MKLAPAIDFLFFKKIFKATSSKSFKLWQRSNAEIFTFSRGTHGLIFLAEQFKCKHHRMPVIALPDLFCRGTLDALEIAGVKLSTYSIDKNLEINLIELKIKPDFLLVTNFFGSQSINEEIKKYCKKAEILLIEDCAHLLYKKEGLIEADITFYTPYKFFAVPDGAIFQIDRKVLRKLNIKGCPDKIDMPNFSDVKWMAKKILSRYIPHSIYKNLIKNDLSFEHQYQGDVFPVSLPMNGLSYFFLSRLNEEDVVPLISKRKFNKQMMEGAVRLLLPEANYEIKSSPSGLSWNLALIFTTTEQARTAFNILSNQGLLVQSWPDLKSRWGNGLWQEKKIIVLPIHQGLNFYSWLKQQKKQLTMIQLTDDSTMATIQNNLVHHNLLQSSYYGEIKNILESKKISRHLITYQNKNIGYLQLLKKNIGPFNIYRINRGPIYFDQENLFVEYLGLSAIRKFLKLEGRGILAWNPDSRLTEWNRSILFKDAFFLLKESETHTVWMDLKLSEELLRKNLKTNWRNHLAKAEKNALILKTITHSINTKTLIDDYQEQQSRNTYSGLPAALVSKLIERQDSINRTWLFQAYSEDQCISQILISLHGKSATYLIGINHELGRKLSANYFLLWQAILLLKAHGIESLDLGGLGITRTPAIASFKLGMGGDEYYFAGEYLGIIF